MLPKQEDYQPVNGNWVVRNEPTGNGEDEDMGPVPLEMLLE
jgi:hypothetical protein